MQSILRNVDWRAVSTRVRRETTNREKSQPLVSMYHWWARRPTSVVDALLDSATSVCNGRSVIADPFSGGGTVAVQAAARGLPVYAQDLHPWAAWALRTSLVRVDPDRLLAAGRTLLEMARGSRGEAYKSRCVEHTDSTTIHSFRVLKTSCVSCGETSFLFPYSLVTVASRSRKEGRGYFGCRRCGFVSVHRFDAKRVRCTSCETWLPPAHRSLLSNKLAVCPHCHFKFRVALDHQRTEWSLVLLQRLCQEDSTPNLHFDRPREEDHVAADATYRRPNLPFSLLDEIPRGVETERLQAFGFRTWADLYPNRQLDALLRAREVMDDMSETGEVKDRLLLCIIGATEMAGHLCRWDRFHPKIFEALANHRYSFDGLAVEPNPLSSIGRGTIARRIVASAKAAKWWNDRMSSTREVSFASSDRNVRRTVPPWGHVRVVQGSSHRILLPDDTVSLVLTDPPYFDSVQYAELASLFLVWMQAGGLGQIAGRFEPQMEAVPNYPRGTSADDYERILRSIFAECARVLAPDGRLVLTFHSTNLKAWAALASALRNAGFGISALAVTRSENSLDNLKWARKVFVSDLVVECEQGNTTPSPEVVTVPRTPQERELVYAGLTMANAPNCQYETVRNVYIAYTRRMRSKRIEAPSVIGKAAKQEATGCRRRKAESRP